MTAAAPRTANGTPDLRRVGVSLGAMTLAVALLIAVALAVALLIAVVFIRPAASPSAAVSGQARDLVVNGTNGGAIRYTGIPYPSNDAAPGEMPGLHGGPLRIRVAR